MRLNNTYAILREFIEWIRTINKNQENANKFIWNPFTIWAEIIIVHTKKYRRTPTCMLNIMDNKKFV